MVEFKEILEFLAYILKMIIYFDTERIKYQQFGGGNNAGNNAPPEEDEEKDASDEAAEDAGSAGLLWILTFIKDIVMGVIKWFGGKVTKLAGMLLFASVAPIIPFFVSMAGLFGVMKYMMFKLRRL